MVEIKALDATRYLPDANALMDSAEGLKNEKAGIFNEVLKASNQEEVIHKNLKREYIPSRGANIRIFFFVNLNIKVKSSGKAKLLKIHTAIFTHYDNQA